MWYAGIDWADEHHDALVIDEKGHQVGSIRVDHTPQGIGQVEHVFAADHWFCAKRTDGVHH